MLHDPGIDYVALVFLVYMLTLHTILVLHQFLALPVQVSVACGSAEKLSKVQEPSRCEYVAELLTPAACTPESAQALQSKLTALDSDADDEHIEL